MRLHFYDGYTDTEGSEKDSENNEELNVGQKEEVENAQEMSMYDGRKSLTCLAVLIIGAGARNGTLKDNNSARVWCHKFQLDPIKIQKSIF